MTYQDSSSLVLDSTSMSGPSSGSRALRRRNAHLSSSLVRSPAPSRFGDYAALSVAWLRHNGRPSFNSSTRPSDTARNDAKGLDYRSTSG